jgi:hypothetical protein
MVYSCTFFFPVKHQFCICWNYHAGKGYTSNSIHKTGTWKLKTLVMHNLYIGFVVAEVICRGYIVVQSLGLIAQMVSAIIFEVQHWCTFSLYMCFCMLILNLQRRKLLLIQTRFLKKYFQIYKQGVGKFALNSIG